MGHPPKKRLLSDVANANSNAALPITAEPMTTLVSVFAFSDIRPLRALAMIEMPMMSRSNGMTFLTPHSTTPFVLTVGPAAVRITPSTEASIDTAISPSPGSPSRTNPNAYTCARADAHRHRSLGIVPDPDHDPARESPATART